MSLVTVRRALLLGAIALGTVSCTENAGVSPSPTSQSLFAPQFTGNWIGTATHAEMTPYVVDGCVLTTYDQRIIGQSLGNENVTLALSQDGNRLEGRLGSATTGLACTYNGTSDGNTIALDAASCDEPVLVLRCPAQLPDVPETVHSMEIIGSTIQGTVVSGRLTGTLTTAYHIDVKEPGAGNQVSRVTLRSNINVARP